MAREPVDWSQFRSDEERSNASLRYYCSHLVGLAGSYQPIAPNGDPIDRPMGFCYSGFLLEVGSATCLVTAGHAIRKLDKAIADKRLVLTSCGLVDSWGINAVDGSPIPFVYEDAPRVHYFSESEGLDFALIMLSDYYVNLLHANNAEPITRENWIPRENITHDSHIMLGFPSYLVDDYTKAFVPKPIILPITRLEKAPAGYERPFERFVGQIPPNVQIADIEGMSGGPIFGIGTAADGERRYWTVAVQSSWHPERRITFGCPIEVFMSIVEMQLDEHCD